jgi:Lon protease-like protein
MELADGRWILEVRGEARIEVEAWLPDEPYPVALVTEPNVVPASGSPVPVLEEALQRVRRARAVLAEHGEGRALPPEFSLDEADAEVASWQLCAAAPVSAYDAQRLLATGNATERVLLLVKLMEELELDLHRMLNQE